MLVTPKYASKKVYILFKQYICHSHLKTRTQLTQKQSIKEETVNYSHKSVIQCQVKAFFQQKLSSPSRISMEAFFAESYKASVHIGIEKYQILF